MSATTLICKVFNRVIEEINRDLYNILKDFVDFNIVRKFVVDYTMLDCAEMLLFSAFQACKNEIFYQD